MVRRFLDRNNLVWAPVTARRRSIEDPSRDIGAFRFRPIILIFRMPSREQSRASLAIRLRTASRRLQIGTATEEVRWKRENLGRNRAV